MSKISQELKVLLYLNQRSARSNYIPISEIADYLEVSDRQARRYLEDLCLIDGLVIETKHGRDGGYRLKEQLDKGFALSENLVLAMSIAMKRNEMIEKVLVELPNYVISDVVVGDNSIDNETLDNLEIILRAIQYQKELVFQYKELDYVFHVQPYKIVFTNHTYYLYLTHDDIIKKFDVSGIYNIKVLGSFKPNDNVLEEIESRLSRYGIKNGNETTLKVKCKDEMTLRKFDRYYESKGVKDLEELTYTVVSNSENELFYPLFRISSKDYIFLDEDFKKSYINYMKKQIENIEEQNSDGF